MKLRADRTQFAEAVAWVTRTVGTRVSLPALSGVYLEATSDSLICRATDLEVAAEILLPVQVETPGRVLLPGRLLAQLVARFPDAPVELSSDGERVEIACGRARFRVRGMHVDDFPSLAKPAVDAPSGVLRSDAFSRMVSQVARAASTDEGRPVLTGVHLDAANGSVRTAATDSYRLAVRNLSFESPIDGSALIPARSLQEAAKAAAELGGSVSVVLEDSQVSFLFGDRRLTTKLIEGTFPNYQALLPDGFETKVTVDRSVLVEALQRVAIVAMGQSNTPVSLTFSDGTIELSATNHEMGDAVESVPATIQGDGLTIAFNPAFLLSGLDATGSDSIVIELRDGLKPAVLRPHSESDRDTSDDLTYLLMPMRVN